MRRSAIVFVALLALLPAPGAGAQANGALVQDDANLVLLEVRFGQHQLSDSITAYQYDDDVFLPLGELARLLTLSIRTQPGEGRASGYVLDEQRSFSLDVTRREVNLGEQREPLDRALVKLRADDIYVASRLLARWLPAGLEVDLPSLTLLVHPREKLPLQARLERSERDKRGVRGQYADPHYPRWPTPYRLADTPFIDQTLGVDVRRASGVNERSTAYTAYLTADLLALEAELFVSRRMPERSTELRWSLGRNDPDANLLGPLRARTVMIGSVPVPGVANIALSSATGNGFTVGNRPLNQPTRFDRHSLQGDLPPGWDVELYFNEALVAFQQARPDGKYNFDDLPLIYGLSEFRLVFHGPLGQLRVERQTFLLEQSLIAPGQLVYSLTEQHDERGHQRAVAQFDWGLTRQLSATGGLVRLAVAGEQQRYRHLGLHAYLRAFILSGSVVRSDNGGALAQLGLKTQVRGLALGISHAQLQDFTSDLYLPSGDPIRARDELSADGVLPAGPVPLSLQVRRDTLASGGQNIELSGRISTYQYGTALSNTLRWQSLRGARSADGIVQLSRRVAGVGVSGQLHYAIEPQWAASTLAISADKALAEGYLLNLGVMRAFQHPEYRLSAALNKSLGSFGLGINGFYSSRHEYGVGMQLFVAMGLEPRRSRWINDAQPMAGSGAASARVFLDKNQNGVMDDGDEPLEGAGFTVNGGANLSRTDAAGIAYLGRLPARQNVDIGVDVSTLDDPQLAALQKGYRIAPRAGKVSQLDFAVSVTGEIDGTTYLMTNGARRAVGDLQLELVDRHGKVVATANSASDGYFVVSSVIPGDYMLRISREQLRRLELNDLGSHMITIERDGKFVNGKELYVEAIQK